MKFHWYAKKFTDYQTCCRLSRALKMLPVYCCSYCSVTKSYLTLQPHGLQHARLPCPSLSLPFVMLNFTLHAAVDGESPSWTPRRNTPWLAQPSEIWTLYWERWSSLSWRKRNTVRKENREEERKRRETTTWMLLLWLNLTTKDLEVCYSRECVNNEYLVPVTGYPNNWRAA